jgi:hypothetical protein
MIVDEAAADRSAQRETRRTDADNVEAPRRDEPKQ